MLPADMVTHMAQVDTRIKSKKEKAPQKNLRGFFLPSK
jgi:hypothetical protein